MARGTRPRSCTPTPGAKRRAEMGFFEGWGTCLDQLVEYIKSQG